MGVRVEWFVSSPRPGGRVRDVAQVICGIETPPRDRWKTEVQSEESNSRAHTRRERRNGSVTLKRYTSKNKMQKASGSPTPKARHTTSCQ